MKRKKNIQLMRFGQLAMKYGCKMHDSLYKLQKITTQMGEEEFPSNLFEIFSDICCIVLLNIRIMSLFFIHRLLHVCILQRQINTMKYFWKFITIEINLIKLQLNEYNSHVCFPFVLQGHDTENQKHQKSRVKVMKSGLAPHFRWISSLV